MATHSSIFAWKIPGRGAWWAIVHGAANLRVLQFMVSQSVRHNLVPEQQLEFVLYILT